MDMPFVKLFKRVDGELIFIQDFQWDAEMIIYREEHPGFQYEVQFISMPPPIPPLPLSVP
jgi:hypothetical protein